MSEKNEFNFPTYRRRRRPYRSPRRWNSEKTAGDSSAMRVRSRMLTPSSKQVAYKCRHCAEVRVKHRRLHCLGRVDATCDKSDNRLYVLKTDYRLETGLPIYRLPF